MDLMEILNSWWFGLAAMAAVSFAASWIVKKARKDARVARMMVLATAFAMEAVPFVEERWPKGKSPGAFIKLDEALRMVKRKLNNEGYSVEIISPVVDKAIREKINDAHASASSYKNVHLMNPMGGK